MSLLTIAQDILKEFKNPSLPLTIVGNNQSAAMQVLAALKNSITALARDYDWQEMGAIYEFTSIENEPEYDLPTDLGKFLPDTFWNVSKRRPCQGVMSPIEWRILKNSVTGAAAFFDYYRIRNNKIELYPLPSTDDYIFEYITNTPVISAGGTLQTNWQADTDLPVIDEYIVRLDTTWRLLKNLGLPYAEEKKLAEDAIQNRISVNGGKKTIYHCNVNAMGPVGFPFLIRPPV